MIPVPSSNQDVCKGTVTGLPGAGPFMMINHPFGDTPWLAMKGLYIGMEGMLQCRGS